MRPIGTLATRLARALVARTVGLLRKRPQNRVISRQAFDRLTWDPDKGKRTLEAVAELETALAAEEAGMIDGVKDRAAGGLGIDFVTESGLEIDVKAFRSEGLNEAIVKTIRNAQADPQKVLLLDPRGLSESELKRVQNQLIQALGKGRVFTAPRHLIRGVEGR
jgi:hypothetical protein